MEENKKPSCMREPFIVVSRISATNEPLLTDPALLQPLHQSQQTQAASIYENIALSLKFCDTVPSTKRGGPALLDTLQRVMIRDGMINL